MNLSRQITLGLAILGLCVGRAAAADQEVPPSPFQGPDPTLTQAVKALAIAEPAAGEADKKPAVAEPAAKDAGKKPAVTESATSNPAKGMPLLAPGGMESLTAPAWGACESCWQNVCDCCENCPSGVVAGVGLYIMQPYYNNNMAFGLEGTANRSSVSQAAVPGIRFDQRVEFSHHVEAAPLIWLGYLSESGLGFRARWWYFREGVQQSANGNGSQTNGFQVFTAAPLGLSLINATSGAGLSSSTATSKLQVQVFDLDTLYEVSSCKWDLLLVGGLRLASIDQTYNAYSSSEALLSSSVFAGIGPSLGVEARRSLGDRGLTLYGTTRGAILFGGGHQRAIIPTRNVQAQDHRDIGMPVGEAEVGLEYSRNVGAAHFFGQIGLVGQEWFGAGSASRSSIDVIPSGTFSSSAYSGDSDLAFLGLVIRLGLNY
jgi:hypothetical protein